MYIKERRSPTGYGFQEPHIKPVYNICIFRNGEVLLDMVSRNHILNQYIIHVYSGTEKSYRIWFPRTNYK